MPNHPIAKKLLNTKRKTAATMPVVVLVCEVAPARIAIDICGNISLIGAREKKYSRMESYSLTSRTKQHELSSSKLLDGEDSDERGEKVLGAV
jgi:hypothetical protein